MVFLAIALGFIGIILALSGFLIIMRKHSYDQCSQPVTATVIYKHSHSGKAGWVFELQVVYGVNGIEYKKYMRTSGEDYDLQYEGSKIDLLCKPGNPKRAVRPLSQKDVKNGGILLIIGAAMIAVGVVLFIMGQIQ